MSGDAVVRRTDRAAMNQRKGKPEGLRRLETYNCVGPETTACAERGSSPFLAGDDRYESSDGTDSNMGVQAEAPRSFNATLALLLETVKYINPTSQSHRIDRTICFPIIVRYDLHHARAAKIPQWFCIDVLAALCRV
jgi:hypothetical protein